MSQRTAQVTFIATEMGILFSATFTASLHLHTALPRSRCQVRYGVFIIYPSLIAFNTGLSYLGRTDDMVVFPSGLKANVLPLEKQLNEHEFILRSAIIYDSRREVLLALIQPQVETPASLDTMALLPVVMGINSSLPFERRLLPENILVVEHLPVTGKLTLARKRVKKIISALTSNNEIIQAFGRFLETNAPTGKFKIRKGVISLLADIFHVPEAQFDETHGTFLDIPLTSLSSVQLARALEDQFSIKITAAQLYGIHSVDELCAFIMQGVKITEPPSPSIQATAESTLHRSTDIVFTGAACRFPGGIDSLDSFWFALLSPDKFVGQLPQKRPSSRWLDSLDKVDEENICRMGWLDDSLLDVISLSRFFSITPAEVESMSPNSRLVLKLGYEAIQDAGIAPQSLNGKAWGIFTALNDSGWRERRVQSLTPEGELLSSLLSELPKQNPTRLCKRIRRLSRRCCRR